jgi:hypothetical protein
MRVSRRSMRLLTVSLALALPSSMAAVAFTGSAATAANPKPSEKCKKLNANLHQSKGKMSKCKSDGPPDNPAQGEVNGIGVFPTALLLGGAGPFNIGWTGPVGSEYHGTLTQVSAVGVVAIPPGVDEIEQAPATPCPAPTPQELELMGVIGPIDSASGDAHGQFAMEVCVNNGNGTVVLEPGTAVRFGEGPNS